MKRSRFFAMRGMSFGTADIAYRHGVGLRCRIKLLEHCGHHVIQTDGASATLSKSAFVKKFVEQWRNNLFLKTIIMDFPRTRTSKKTDTSHLAAECQMHWKSVTANQTPMIRDIPQVLKNRRSFGQDVHD